MTDTKSRWNVRGDLNWGLYHVSAFPKPNSSDEDEKAIEELRVILAAHDALLAAAEAVLEAEDSDLWDGSEWDILRTTITKAKGAK